ncbi:hypothetical protein ScPMuIL_004835 [Solemya velum]
MSSLRNTGPLEMNSLAMNCSATLHIDDLQGLFITDSKSMTDEFIQHVQSARYVMPFPHRNMLDFSTLDESSRICLNLTDIV